MADRAGRIPGFRNRKSTQREVLTVDQNPDCDIEGCESPATWILLADFEDSDSLLCVGHIAQLRNTDPERARLFGPLNEIVIRQPPFGAPTGEKA